MRRHEENPAKQKENGAAIAADGQKKAKKYMKNTRKKFTKETLTGFFRKEEHKRHLRQGSYASFLTLFVIAAAVLVNLIVAQLPSSVTQIDVSEQKLYSLTDATKEMLKGLQKDVSIYYIVTGGNEDTTVEKMLERYEELSPHLKVEKKDPNLYPKFAGQYTDDTVSENSLLVVCGDKSRVVAYNDMWETSIDYMTYSQQTTGYDGEGQVTSAINYVTSDTAAKLYWITGHGEIGQSALSSYFKDAVAKANMEVEELPLLTSEIPEDTDCLVIMAPETDFAEAEANKVIDYLENGGKALVFTSYTDTNQPNLDRVLETYGVQRKDGIAVETDNRHYYPQMPYVLLPDIQSSEITADAGSYVLVPMAQAIVPLEVYRDSLKIESLLVTTENAYVETDPENSVWSNTGDAETGAFAVGVSVTETVGSAKTQLVYFSSVNMLAESFDGAVAGSNTKVVLGALNQMCEIEETTNVPIKSLEYSSLVFTAASVNLWGTITIAVIPLGFVVTGFVIWLKRRKQ